MEEDQNYKKYLGMILVYYQKNCTLFAAEFYIINSMIKSADEFKHLRESENPDEYNRAANDEAPIAVWIDVIKKYPDLRFWVAQNKTVPVEILAILADDTDSNIRGMVARKRKLTKELQLKLTRDPDESVRMALACNTKTTRKILEILSNDSWSEIRDHCKERLQ